MSRNDKLKRVNGRWGQEGGLATGNPSPEKALSREPAKEGLMDGADTFGWSGSWGALLLNCV